MTRTDWNPQHEVKSRKQVDERVLAARERAMLREGLAATARTMAWSVALGSVALLVAVYLLQRSFAAAQQILQGQGEYWYEAYMPAVLLGLLGAAFGVFAGWRLDSSGGIVGWPGWIIAATGVLATAAVGAAGAAVCYTPPIPFTFWIALGGMVVTAMLALTFYTLWAA
jgi:hypothetical protein